MSLNYARGTLKSSGSTIVLRNGEARTTTLSAVAPTVGSQVHQLPDLAAATTDTVVMAALAQTLTNKTLTAPTISGNGTITSGIDGVRIANWSGTATYLRLRSINSDTGSGAVTIQLAFDATVGTGTRTWRTDGNLKLRYNNLLYVGEDGTNILSFGDNGGGGPLADINAAGLTARRAFTLPDTAGTVALTANKLSAFAATTSAELAGVISDETGSGVLVFGTSPALTTPAIAGGTATGLTGLAIRDTSAAFDVTLAATSSSALTAGRTLTLDMVNAARTIKLQGNLDIGGTLTTAAAFSTSGANALTLTTTGATNVTLPTTGTLATLGGTEIFSGAKTFTADVAVDNQKALLFYETDANGSNYIGLKAPASVTADKVFTLPDGDGAANQVLKTDGAGALGWASVTSKVTSVRGQMIRRGASADEAFTASTNNRVVRGDGTDAVLGQIDATDFFAAGAYATGSAAGTLPPVTSMSDALATQLGYKQYLNGSTYNGSITISISQSNVTGSVAVGRGVLIPYQMQDGTWRLKFNIACSASGGMTGQPWTVTINNLVFKAGQNQAIVANQDQSGSLYTNVGRASQNTGDILGYFSSNTVTAATFSGDVELNAKPGWAY